MKPNSKKPGPLKLKTLSLAIRIVKLSRYLIENKREYIISKQILRSGTSLGAMVREAEHAESGVDFIHKLSIAQKEVNETLYWLELLLHTGFLPLNQYNSILNDTEEVMKLLASSIKTRRKNLSLTVNH